MGKIIEIQNLTFSYGNSVIFNDLSLEVSEGTICTVLGSTGSGKSSLARILMGLEDAHGYIKIHGLYLNPKNIQEIRTKTGILYENPELEFITEKVGEEISFSFKNLGYSKDKIKEETKKISQDFYIEHLLSRNIYQLSAGEKQLVALVAQLASRPKMLVLDEALSMLDKVLKKKVWNQLKKYQQEQAMTIIHFTDDSEDALEGTNVLILSEGKIVLQGDKKEVFQSEKVFTTNQLELPFFANLSSKLQYYNTITSPQIELEQLVNAIWK